MTTKSRQKREMYNHPTFNQMMSELGKYELPESLFNPRYNAIYDQETIRTVIMEAAMHDISVGGYLNGRNMINALSGNGINRVYPSDEWFRRFANSLDSEEIQKFFQGVVRDQYATLARINEIPPDGVDVSVDGHDISRHDKTHGVELRKSKRKNGTNLFEGYVTAHCVTKNFPLVLGAFPRPALTNLSDFVRKLVELCIQNGIKIRYLLLDREFCTAEIMRLLDEMNIKYIIPCKNTPRVVEELCRYDSEKQPKSNRVQMVMKPSEGEDAPYTMIIVKRKKVRAKKKSELLPEEKLIGFATNDPNSNVETYAKRWGIETGYRIVENMRAKTRSKNIDARIFCFLFSLIIYNMWIIARILLGLCAQNHSTLTQIMFKILVLQKPEGVLEPRPP